MIDPTQLPILMKAIDFVLEEGHKILEERRERRKVQEGAPQEAVPEPVVETAAPPAEQVEEVKQDLLHSKIDEILWQDHEAEVQHLVRLLETYSRNHHLAQEQYAKWGSALVPPIIVSNLTESENSMLETIKQLETILSKVYQKEIGAQK
jgi:hypothetical protein